MSTTAPPEPRSPGLRQAPVLRTTAHDKSSAALTATLIGLSLVTAVIAALYIMTRPAPPPKLIPLEIVDDATGGEENGEPDSTLQVESELAPQPDAAPVEQMAEQTELTETLEVITELADQAAEIVPDQTGEASLATGVPGSADGTGLPSLGSGPGSGGVPRAQRWLVSFSDGASLKEYGTQLDYFGIELGTIGADGTLSFASGLGTASPKTRTVKDGSSEKRLYFSWQGGRRKAADQQLLSQTGINAAGRPILHFYPGPTENQLAVLEKKAARKPVNQIRRTYFDVVAGKGGGYEFKVKKILYF